MVFSGESIDKAEKEFEGKGYADFKKRVGEVVIEFLKPVQAEYKKLLADKNYLQSVMKSGAERAARIARRTLSKVYRKVGFVPLEQ